MCFDDFVRVTLTLVMLGYGLIGEKMKSQLWKYYIFLQIFRKFRHFSPHKMFFFPHKKKIIICDMPFTFYSCMWNSQLVVDVDHNGKFRVERALTFCTGDGALLISSAIYI